MSKSPPPKFAVLFDMDGVLMDTVPASMHARKIVAKTYGFTPQEMLQHSKPGRSLRDFYQTLQSLRPFDASFKIFADHMLEQVFAYLEKHPQADNPDLVAFIDDLKAHGIPIAVGTSALKRSALRKLALVKLQDSFDAIVTADDAERHKPHPDIYQKAARQLHMPPKRCVVIEDAQDGIAAGRAAGMKVIGYSKFTSDAAQLKMADLIVANFSELSYQRLSELVSI